MIMSLLEHSMVYTITNGYEFIGTFTDLDVAIQKIKDDVTKKEKTNEMKLELKAMLYDVTYQTFIYEYPTLYKEVYIIETKKY